VRLQTATAALQTLQPIGNGVLQVLQAIENSRESQTALGVTYNSSDTFSLHKLIN
jgi:hypothetical protein